MLAITSSKACVIMFKAQNLSITLYAPTNFHAMRLDTLTETPSKEELSYFQLVTNSGCLSLSVASAPQHHRWPYETERKNRSHNCNKIWIIWNGKITHARFVKRTERTQNTCSNAHINVLDAIAIANSNNLVWPSTHWSFYNFLHRHHPSIN